MARKDPRRPRAFAVTGVAAAGVVSGKSTGDAVLDDEAALANARNRAASEIFRRLARHRPSAPLDARQKPSRRLQESEQHSDAP